MTTLVVYAHPLADSFAAAVRDRVVAGLAARGGAVDLLDLYAEGVEPAVGRADPTVVARHADRLEAATAVVFVYPTWWGGPPAMMKGWIDTVWSAATGASHPGACPATRLRRIRRLTVVTTHGSNKLLNAAQGEPGKRLVLRGLRTTCHPMCRSRWVSLYGIDRSSDTDRARFLDRVEQHFSKRR